MIRFVIGPGAIVVPDLRQKLPGRGLWVTARAEKVSEAVKRQVFSRAFKAKVSASEHLAGEVEALLAADCLQSLSIANKAGAVVTGFGKVEDKIASGDVAALLHAADAGDDGVRKLSQALRRRFASTNDVISFFPKDGDGQSATPQIKLFYSAQLDLALGRSNVIHAALLRSAASEAFLKRFWKLSNYCSAGARIAVENESVEVDLVKKAGDPAPPCSGSPV